MGVGYISPEKVPMKVVLEDLDYDDLEQQAKKMKENNK
jgi:hypothetical protein